MLWHFNLDTQLSVLLRFETDLEWLFIIFHKAFALTTYKNSAYYAMNKLNTQKPDKWTYVH